jgi:hypothetical protein
MELVIGMSRRMARSGAGVVAWAPVEAKGAAAAKTAQRSSSARRLI